MKAVSSRIHGRSALALAFLALLLCTPMIGQVLKGSISGTVTDPQGAVVSGAQVKATQKDSGVVFSTTSDGAGLFRFNLLPIGPYSVEISASKFQSAKQD